MTRLQPRLLSNFATLDDKIADKKVRRIVIKTPFFSFSGTPDEFQAVKADFRHKLVEYLKARGMEVNEHKPKKDGAK